VRLLLAEDERRAGEYLVKGLGESGFVVDWVRNGMDALHHARSEAYDLIILDIGLPHLDGWSVLERIREERQTPVLFLTARDRVEDRVRGLELGADDYLVKPFAFSELPMSCGSRTWRCTSCGGAWSGPGSASSSPPRSTRCSCCSCAAKGRCCRAR